MKFTPLFWPIEYKNNTIYILDETRLPKSVAYIKARDYKQSVAAIKQMKTRAVGQVLLVFYIFLLEINKNKHKKDLLAHLEKVAEAINKSRPTLAFKMLTDMVLFWAKTEVSLERNILGFLEGLKNKRIEQAREVCGFIKDKDVILTHCNVSGLMPLIAQICKEQNKHISFYVTETRPYLQGLRLTAWELQLAGFAVTVIADNMVAQVMHEGKVNKVIVGADHLAQNGDIANKIGTYQIALLAKHFNIPFYVLCPPASKAESGKDIKIEIRPSSELFEYYNFALSPKGIDAYYPAFDITPNNLISRHIHLKV